MTARAARFVLPVLVLMAVMAPTASATTKEKTVKGEVVFAHGQRPGDPGDCSAIVFVKWADVPGTVSARAIYTFNGSERSESLPAPFNDTFKFVADYQVPAGYHWIAVGRSWANGPVANTCEETSEAEADHRHRGQRRTHGRDRPRGLQCREGQAGRPEEGRQPVELAAAQSHQSEGEEGVALQDREGQDEARGRRQARARRLLTNQSTSAKTALTAASATGVRVHDGVSPPQAPPQKRNSPSAVSVIC
jgi:hypothetical protein